MQYGYKNGIYALIAVVIAISVSAYAQQKESNVIIDSQLQLATYSILNTDTPIPQGAAAVSPAAPKPEQAAGGVSQSVPANPVPGSEFAPINKRAIGAKISLNLQNAQEETPAAPVNNTSEMNTAPLESSSLIPAPVPLNKTQSASAAPLKEVPALLNQGNFTFPSAPAIEETPSVPVETETPAPQIQTESAPAAPETEATDDSLSIDALSISETPAVAPIAPQEAPTQINEPDVPAELPTLPTELEIASEPQPLTAAKNEIPSESEDAAASLGVAPMPVQKSIQSESAPASPAAPARQGVDTRMAAIVDGEMESQSPAVTEADSESIAESNAEITTDNKFTFNPFDADEAKKNKGDYVNNVLVKAASFDGVTPGTSTMEEVAARWGAPAKSMQNGAMVMHQYLRSQTDNISEIQTIYTNQILTTVLVQFRQPLDVADLAGKLRLSALEPVEVSRADGVVLGQAYPERGISFAYDVTASDKNKVSRLILEKIQNEPFVLRAEARLTSAPDAAAADLEYVLNKENKHAAAHWLLGRYLAAQENLEPAIEHLEKAVALDYQQPRYFITLAQARAQAGLVELALKAADKAIELANSPDNKREHLIAAGLCLKGDLIASQANPDYAAALECHSKAIVEAQNVVDSAIPAVKKSVLETMTDAHLGAAHDIAWGNWNQKATAVPRWLKQADKYNQQLILVSHMTEKEQCQSRLRLAMRALSACAGIGKEADPTPWVEQLIVNGDKLVEIADSNTSNERLLWDMGMSIYDAVQIYQARGEAEKMLQYGKKAVECLESAQKESSLTDGKFTATDLYIQGRLYFRLGAMAAISKNDHAEAVRWYAKTLPIFESVADGIPRTELGRLGETLVSMGVSYWETGKQKQAVNLTENGIYCLEQAVDEELAGTDSLEIPYRNLSMMLKYLGNAKEAGEYLQKADAVKTTVR